VQNPLGRMVEAYTNSTCNGHANLVTDKWFSYSPRGEVTDIYTKTPNSGGFYHMTKSYWANGAVETLAGIPGVPTITYGADGEGRPSTVNASAGQNPVTQTLYNAASQVTSLTYGSADSDTYQYDPNTGRMTQYSFNVNGSSVIGKPAWNSNGTLLTLDITDPFNSANTQNCTYGFDALARVNSVGCGSTWAQTFTYDPFGNITKSGSISWMPGYNTANNHYTLSGTTYDNDGNLTADTFHTYQWDPQGHPVVLDNINSSFDALGNLAEQDAPTWNQEYVYDENGKQIGAAVGQSTGYAYIPLPGGAQVLYSPEGSLPTIYIHADWLGSARLHSTQSRTIYGDTAFAPFGETYANTNTTDPYHFAAYPLDFALGLYDTAAREYHTTQGRWLTPDPAGLSAVDPTNPQSWNRYAYVLNNPMSFTDPTGLMTINPNWYMGFAGGGGNCSLDGVDATCNMVNALAAGGALVYFPSNCTYVACQTSAGFVPISQQDNGQFGGCGQSGWSYFCLSFAPTPVQLSDDAGGGSVGVIRAGPPGAKKAFCDSQSNKAALAKIIPGGEYLFQHQFTPEAALAAGIDIGTDIGLDLAKDSVQASLLSWLKHSVGVSGQTVGRIGTFLKVLGAAGTAYTGYQAMKAMQGEYAYCME
jgi:RHS repeat-associated protein